MKGRCPILVGLCVYWMIGILDILVKIEDLDSYLSCCFLSWNWSCRKCFNQVDVPRLLKDAGIMTWFLVEKVRALTTWILPKRQFQTITPGAAVSNSPFSIVCFFHHLQNKENIQPATNSGNPLPKEANETSFLGRNDRNRPKNKCVTFVA